MPALGSFIKDANTARFGSTLAILTSSGVPLVEAMRIAGQVVMNIPIQEALVQATVSVSEGGSLHKALEETGYFPPIMFLWSPVAKTAASWIACWRAPAAQQETTLQNTVEALVKVAEPVMLLLVMAA